VNFSNAEEMEKLYQQFLKDPKSVDPTFAFFFHGLALSSNTQLSQSSSKDERIKNLKKAYRTFGHLEAHIDPVKMTSDEKADQLSLDALGFKEGELDQLFPTLNLLDQKEAPLKTIINRLKELYCKSIGYECNPNESPELAQFIYDRIESQRGDFLSREDKVFLLHTLNRSEVLESFIQLRYPGQKRFSIEGGETFIPLLIESIEQASLRGVNACVVGMAHRGRLNVLANVFGKPYSKIFHEFDSSYVPTVVGISGDVKYHLGYESTYQTRKGKSVDLLLCANPSHLESVDPIVLGRAKAKQNKAHDIKSVLPILVHGDGAVSGQGIVYEILQMQKLDGFTNFGSLHIVINNQIGFTANSREGRSTRYCTDIAKAFSCPIFHVNAEDPESCLFAADLAIQVRQQFGVDVFIDLNCYRKFGHNETDEPRFTNPLLYDLIGRKELIRNIYLNQLIQENTLTHEAAKTLEADFKSQLEAAFNEMDAVKSQKRESIQAIFDESVATCVDEKTLYPLVKMLSLLPEKFQVHAKLKRMVTERHQQFENNAIDWALCEQLAYATLLTSKIPVRIVGEDSRRGTFSHRHAALFDQVTGHHLFQLNHLKEGQAFIEVYNSFLSEYAALGFEYGYSVEDKTTLVIWEAQFGDFANCAQVVMDQYLSASFQKWHETCGLTLLLPHGYEGMGPEHSSARIERFLQLSAQNNMEVIYPTKAAQFFHVLRRQALKPHKTPLVIFTPKSFLRAKESFASKQDLTSGRFEDFIVDTKPSHAVTKLLLTTGKIYYELDSICKEQNLNDTALISVERLYPFNTELLKKQLANYPNLKKIVYVQEEHENMGACTFIREILESHFKQFEKKYVTRERAASTAAGSHTMHIDQQKKLIQDAAQA